METTTVEPLECFECERPIVTPVRDEDEVSWLGIAKSRVWCSSDCMENTADRRMS